MNAPSKIFSTQFAIVRFRLAHGTLQKNFLKGSVLLWSVKSEEKKIHTTAVSLNFLLIGFQR